MMSGLLSAELSATCNALGYLSGTTYYTDPYVKETITDLIRYLRRDDEDHTIRRHLGSAKILQTDIIPILIHHSDKAELFDVVLRLLVNLTNPALLIYEEQLPADRIARHYFIQIISHLQNYKEAFTQQKVWEVLVQKLEELLKVEYNDRDEDQSRTMERILILVRNVLQVPADVEAEKRPDNDASIHDQVLWSLHQAGMVDLFLYIASTDREQQYYMHILEIVSLMLREQNPATLASAALQRSVEEKERDEKELLEIRRREILDKQSKIKKYAGSRHSRFGGTYIVKDVKSISENELIFHKPLNKAVSLSFDFEKQRAKVPKNRLALPHNSSERRSAFSVRLFLKEFCVEFLNGAYNTLMYKVRENLVRSVGQPNDETYYFWAMKFFMEFNRLYNFQVKLISETMHQQIFHFVQTQIENWLQQMLADKKNIPAWSRRVHQALKAYQELLMTLQAMDKSPDDSVRQSAKVIKSNIFYQSEYRELVVFLFNVFTEIKFSRLYLKDLVETTHIFLKMLEKFCSKHQNLVVQGKAKLKQKKRKKAAKKSSGGVDLEAIWDQVAPELSAVLQGQADIPTDIVPFDAVSGGSMDEKKVEAMKKIQLELKQGNFEQAVGLLRASREVWPENDSFGRANMPPEEEFLAMRDIFMADIGAEAKPPEEEGDSEDEEDEEERDVRDIVIPEAVFKFSDFVARFACPKVLAPVSLLLEDFEKNSAFTNHCIVKLLHRVAWDCKMSAMLFQSTVFRTFQRVFKSTDPEHKEIAKFATFIMRKFADMAKNNKKIYMEILFWKTHKDAYELEYGYGSSETKSHSAKNVWREEQEDELRRLAQEYEENTPEPDAVGWIMKNMIDQSRSRRAVIKKLKELYLVVGNMKPKSKEMSEEDISELKNLFEQYKDSTDPMNCILGRLSAPRSRNFIVSKLLELGLISDRKELRKKRAKGNKKSEKELEWGDRSDDESIYDSWSDEDTRAPPSSSIMKDTKVRRVGQPSLAQMCCTLKKVMNAGEELRDALEWLKSSLQEVLDDLPDAECDEEGVALLPLTLSCVQAMDNPIFLQLVDIFSINKPTDQEMYWRIPGSWKAEDLTKRIKLIKDAIEGTLPDIDPDEVEQLIKLPGITQVNSKKEKEEKPKKKSNKSLKQFVRENNDSTEENSHLPTSSSTDDKHERPIKSTPRRKSFSHSDSESDMIDEYESLYNTSKGDAVISSTNKKRVLTLDSDSESEITSIQTNEFSITKEPKTKKFSYGSDSESEITSIQKNKLSITKEPKTKKFSYGSDSESEITSIQTNELSITKEPKTKKFNYGSDSENEINLVKDSASLHNKKNSVGKRKRIIVESDSEDDNNSGLTKVNVGFSNEQRDTNSKSPDEGIVKRKRLSVESGSTDDNALSTNSTNK